VNAPRRAALLAGCAGLALLAFSFLDWYQAGEAGADLWQSFTLTDLLVAVAIGCAVLTGIAALLGDDSGLPVAASSITVGAGLLALVVVLYRLIDPPAEGLTRELGAWLGIAAVAAIVVFSRLGMEEAT
jgi:amino acid transporter